jgi:hypothetical protein
MKNKLIPGQKFQGFVKGKIAERITSMNCLSHHVIGVFTINKITSRTFKFLNVQDEDSKKMASWNDKMQGKGEIFIRSCRVYCFTGIYSSQLLIDIYNIMLMYRD